MQLSDSLVVTESQGDAHIVGPPYPAHAYIPLHYVGSVATIQYLGTGDADGNYRKHDAWHIDHENLQSA